MVWKRAVQRPTAKYNWPGPEAQRAKQRRRKRFLRKRRATPPTVRATFVDDAVVEDAGEKPGTGADAVSARSAVKFEVNLVVRSAVRFVPKHQTMSAVRPAVNRGVK